MKLLVSLALIVIAVALLPQFFSVLSAVPAVIYIALAVLAASRLFWLHCTVAGQAHKLHRRLVASNPDNRSMFD